MERERNTLHTKYTSSPTTCKVNITLIRNNGSVPEINIVTSLSLSLQKIKKEIFQKD